MLVRSIVHQRQAYCAMLVTDAACNNTHPPTPNQALIMTNDKRDTLRQNSVPTPTLPNAHNQHQKKKKKKKNSQPQNHTYAHQFADLEHVSGACQMFRRTCFEDVGGYTPIKGGGIDWVAVTTARVRGWQTRTFVEKTCLHHRTMGTASRSRLMARFRHGQEDYYVGGHPLWQVLRGTFQMKEKPFVLGGLFLMLGYCWAMAKRTQRPVSPELIAFRRAEQMTRLRKMILR